jgi:hypothetical protein
MKLRLSISSSAGAPASTYECKGPECLFGRDPEGHVVLEGNGVSWQHARIDLTSTGADVSDLGSTNGTYLNGRRLTARTSLHPEDEIRLGQHGPRLKVLELHGAVAPAVPLRTPRENAAPRPRLATAENAPLSATRFMLMKMQQSFGTMQSRSRKIILGLTTAVLLIGAALSGGLLYSNRVHQRELAEAEARREAEARLTHDNLTKVQQDADERERRWKAEQAQLLVSVDEKNAKAIAELRSEGADDKETAIYSKYSDAIYFVIAPGPGGKVTVGTAFAVDPRGQFGTNAHVALPAQEALAIGKSPLLVSHGGLRQYEITAAQVHPRYTGVFSHDVGVLSVALRAGETVPTTVSLASQADLRKLKPGTHLLYMGFPVYQSDFSDYLEIDRVLGGFRVKRSKVNARTYRGTLNRLLTFATEKGDFSNEFLLEHDLSGMPGASGSALFTPDGKVVGLLNGMMNVKGKFEAGAPNKTGVRVDLLRELLEHGR